MIGSKHWFIAFDHLKCNWQKTAIYQIRQNFLLPKFFLCSICIDKLDMLPRLHVWMHFAIHWPELRSICTAVLFYSTCNIYLIMWVCNCRKKTCCVVQTPLASKSTFCSLHWNAPSAIFLVVCWVPSLSTLKTLGSNSTVLNETKISYQL